MVWPEIMKVTKISKNTTLNMTTSILRPLRGGGAKGRTTKEIKLFLKLKKKVRKIG